MATLEGIQATLDMLVSSVDRRFDSADEQLTVVNTRLNALNGRMRDTEVCIARLQEQSTMRASLLAGLSVLGAAVAAWLGVTH